MSHDQPHIPSSAVVMIVGAVACFALLDGIIKMLATRQPVPLLVWCRWSFQVLAMLVWLGPRMGTNMVRTSQPWMQLARGGLLVSASLCFMTALKYMPLADATALNYTTPTIVIVLAVVFLRERMTRARVAFLIAGVIGMLLIVRPGADLFSGAAIYALGTAGFSAVYQITTRMLAGEDPRVTLFYPAMVGATLMTFVWPWFGSEIDISWADVALLGLTGALGTVGHFLFILAFQRAPASALTPFTYVQLVFATLVGWMFNKHFPGPYSLIGMTVIAGSGLLLAWHEHRRAQRAAIAPPAID